VLYGIAKEVLQKALQPTFIGLYNLPVVCLEGSFRHVDVLPAFIGQTREIACLQSVGIKILPPQ
jgi:hypothetical protein